MRNVPMCAVCAMSAGPRFLAPGRIVLLTHSMQGEDVGRPEGDERAGGDADIRLQPTYRL